MKDVLFLVPSKSKYVKTLEALFAGIGRTAFERTRAVADTSDRPATRRHIGWGWPCDCLAFARLEGDYLWVPCSRHDVGRPALRR